MNTAEIQKSYRNQKYLKLAMAVTLDMVGMATYMIPGLGEFGDVIWAPVAGLAGMLMFGGVIGAAGGTFTFLEEILPGTDILPGLTMTWMVKYLVRDRQSFAKYAGKHGIALNPE